MKEADFLDWCNVCDMCSDGKVICTNKAARAWMNRLVVCVYVGEKWRASTTPAVGRSSVIAMYFFSIRVPRRNDGSPVECESYTSGGSPLSWCRPSQSPMVDCIVISSQYIYEDYAGDFP